MVNSPCVGPCDTFAFKEPEKATVWPNWSSELLGGGAVRKNSSFKKKKALIYIYFGGVLITAIC